MTDIYVGNKKYSILQKEVINNRDINITSNGNYTPGDGYTGFNVVRVQVPEFVYESLTVNPKTVDETYTPTTGVNGFNEVIAKKVTASIDSNIKAENIKQGISILGVTGTFNYVTDPLTVTPTTLTQVINPTHDGFGTVTVKPVTSEIDNNIKSQNIIQGITILGVAGSAIESKETTRHITANGIYTPETGYTGFSEVTVDVNVINNELNVTPTTSAQTFTAPDQYHGFSPVNVAAVTASIDANIVPENILHGASILGVNGSVIASNETTISITENGTYRPTSPYTGFNEVRVNINTVNNTDITIHSDGTYRPEAPYTGFGTVVVNTSSTLHQKSVTVDSNTPTIFTIQPDQGYVGMSQVDIDLSWVEQQLQLLNAGDVALTPSLQNKTVSAAGQYTCDSGYDGLGTVTVDLSWVDSQIESIASNFTNTTVDGFLTDSTPQLNTDALLLREYACYNMISLNSVTLTSCERIKAHAFEGCTGLRTITILTPTLCTLDEADIPSTITNIYVPSNLVNTYKTASKWSNYSAKISAIS